MELLDILVYIAAFSFLWLFCCFLGAVIDWSLRSLFGFGIFPKGYWSWK